MERPAEQVAGLVDSFLVVETRPSPSEAKEPAVIDATPMPSLAAPTILPMVEPIGPAAAFSETVAPWAEPITTVEVPPADMAIDEEPRREPASAAAAVATATSAMNVPSQPRAPRGRGVHADRQRLQTVYWLAGGLGLISLFAMLPALGHLDLAAAPGWARGAAVVSVGTGLRDLAVDRPRLEHALGGDDRVRRRGGLYGAGMAIAIATPYDQSVLLGMTDIRRKAALWCGGMLTLSFAMSYLCGRAAHRWQAAERLSIARTIARKASE